MPDGQRILGGSNDGTAACGSSTAPSRNMQHGIPSCYPSYVDAVALPDQLALSASGVNLVNVNDGAVLRTFKHHTPGVLPGALPTASARQRLARRTARIVEHRLAPVEL